jgi:hypothetical protein
MGSSMVPAKGIIQKRETNSFPVDDKKYSLLITCMPALYHRYTVRGNGRVFISVHWYLQNCCSSRIDSEYGGAVNDGFTLRQRKGHPE